MPLQIVQGCNKKTIQKSPLARKKLDLQENYETVNVIIGPNRNQDLGPFENPVDVHAFATETGRKK